MDFEKTCETVGELREALKHWPDAKPLIIDVDGSTYSVRVYNWINHSEANDLNWPAAIDGNVL